MKQKNHICCIETPLYIYNILFLNIYFYSSNRKYIIRKFQLSNMRYTLAMMGHFTLCVWNPNKASIDKFLTSIFNKKTLMLFLYFRMTIK